MPKNSKRGHLGSLNVFTNRKLQKKPGDPLIEFENFRKKGGSFGLASTFGSIKKFVVQCENQTRDLLLLRKLVEQVNKRL